MVNLVDKSLEYGMGAGSGLWRWKLLIIGKCWGLQLGRLVVQCSWVILSFGKMVHLNRYYDLNVIKLFRHLWTGTSRVESKSQISRRHRNGPFSPTHPCWSFCWSTLILFDFKPAAYCNYIVGRGTGELGRPPLLSRACNMHARALCGTCPY